VAEAFAMTPGAADLDPARTVILVDDVVTTGATLGAAATVLRVAGVTRISALTAAREL
jgi:predicted amidophosphoribosyltransferase